MLIAVTWVKWYSEAVFLNMFAEAVLLHKVYPTFIEAWIFATSGSCESDKVEVCINSDKERVLPSNWVLIAILQNTMYGCIWFVWVIFPSRQHVQARPRTCGTLHGQ